MTCLVVLASMVAFCSGRSGWMERCSGETRVSTRLLGVPVSVGDSYSNAYAFDGSEPKHAGLLSPRQHPRLQAQEQLSIFSDR